MFLTNEALDDRVSTRRGLAEGRRRRVESVGMGWGEGWGRWLVVGWFLVVRLRDRMSLICALLPASTTTAR